MRILLAGKGYHILEAENGLAATDTKELTDWSRSKHYILLELYRGQTLVYSSFAPKGGIPEKTERDPGDRVAFYEWSPGYTLNFADGEAEALLYYNGLNDYYSTGCDILNMLCLLWWFPGFFLFNSRKIIRYILQLSEEIQAMEGGDLEHPITVRGHDKLTTLASCLDSMRLTLRQQQEEEAQASAKVKSRSPSWWKRCSSGALPARWNWGEEDVLLSVNSQYVRRILDNITSNLLKYADPQSVVTVRFVQEDDTAGLCFENRVLPIPPAAESTKVGLTSIGTMMEKMHGVCRIEQPEGLFRMTLLFNTAKE